MNVLSLFDGISCGLVALERAQVEIDNYYSSEIDKYALKISEYNYPLINRLGDVRSSDNWELPKIGLLMGGSPCQSFSFAGHNNGMTTKCEIEILSLDHYLELKKENFEFEGQSYLFWEYVYILKKVKPKYFFLENVQMNKKWEKIISNTLGIEPVLINSNLLSAQDRRRLYWTNIDFDKDIIDKNLFLRDVWAGGEDITERFFQKREGTLAHKKAWSQVRTLNDKSRCLLAGGQNISNSGATNIKIGDKYFKIDLLTCERLQCLPDNYTKVESISETQRYKGIGNGWNIDTIVHIFKNLNQEPIEIKQEVKMPEVKKEKQGCDLCKNMEICKYFDSFNGVDNIEKICKYFSGINENKY